MKIEVRVKPNSKHEGVDAATTPWTVRVNTPPAEGRANQRAAELLAEHLGIPKSRVTLARGQKSRLKLFLVT